METDKFRGTMEKWFPNRRSPEFEKFRASLGLDFIFYLDRNGQRQISCVEVNGHDAGITGANKISKRDIEASSKTLASIRSMYSVNAFAAIDLSNRSRARLLDYTAGGYDPNDPNLKTLIYKFIADIRRARSVPLMDTAFANCPALEEVLSNKRFHKYIIPENIRPKERSAESARNFPDSGVWLAKPILGSRGTGIKVYKQSDFEGADLPEMDGRYVWQEFLQPLPADKSPEEYQRHPASMRYLVDFVTYTDGGREKLFEFAYQRVSPHSMDSGQSFADIYIVNKALRAHALPISARELAQARQAANEIICKIDETLPKIEAYSGKSHWLFAKGIEEGGSSLFNFINSLRQETP